MKKFVYSIIVFFAIIIASDLAFGFVMDNLNSHSKGGGVAKRYYVFEKGNEEIMMFGSSRMCHHYNPHIIADSLGMSCFNAGEDGSGIIYSYALLSHLIESGRCPKKVIYEIMIYDIYKDDNIKYLTLLKPYSQHPAVMEVIKRVSANERFKLISNLYKYNTVCLSEVFSVLKHNELNAGFEPSYGVLDYEPVFSSQSMPKEVDSLKRELLIDLINKCKENNIELIFCVSPSYGSKGLCNSYPEVTELAEVYGVPMLDMQGCYLSGERNLFADPSHLNAKGADLFTTYFLNEFKRLTLLKNRI